MFPLSSRAPLWCLRITAALLWALVAASAAGAAQTSLTLADAQRRAAERSRELAARDLEVAAAREMGVAAGQLPDPALRVGVDNVPVDGADAWSLTRDFMTMRRIGVMQEFTRADKRRLRAERFEREAERSLEERSATLAEIQRDTALAWLDRYYAEAMAAIIAEQVRAARQEIEAAETAYRGGRGSQADVLAARSAAVSFDDRASEAGRRVRTATTSLARWIGDAAGTPLAGRPDIDRVGLDPRSLDEQLGHHPRIAALAKQTEVAGTEARLAQAARQADWSVELTYSQRGSTYSNMVSFGVAIPLQWDQKNRQDREIAARLAMADQTRARHEEALRAHVAEVRVMIEEWENLRERRARYERELAPLAAERTRALLAAYRGGESSLADVLAARRNELETRLQVLQLEMESARLWARLNFLFPDGAPARDAAGVRSASVVGETR